MKRRKRNKGRKAEREEGKEGEKKEGRNRYILIGLPSCIGIFSCSKVGPKNICYQEAKNKISQNPGCNYYSVLNPILMMRIQFRSRLSVWT